MIKLSIVTITLNDVATIEQTIKSVVDQNYSNQIFHDAKDIIQA